MAHVKVQEAFSESSESGQESDLEIGGTDNSDDEVEEDIPHVQGKGSGGGLAEVMAAILTKTVPNKNKVILAKGQTDREIKIRKRKRDKEEGKIKDDEGDSDVGNNFERMLKRKAWNNMNRVKPQPLDREKEKRLQRITTRGVVQLFNAVRKQQKDLEEGLAEAGSSTRKTEKVLGSISKDKFLDLLKGTAPKSKDKKTTKNEETKPETWKILRDDFMMGAKMKDWDKDDSDESGSDRGHGQMDSSDSD